MTSIAICSPKGSPGVTTLACLVGALWPADRRVVVAEADPSGGDIAPRFGLSSRQGMASLVIGLRRGERDIRGHAQTLPGGLDVLVGAVGPASALALDAEILEAADCLVSPGCDLVLDCGRLNPAARGQSRLLAIADRVLMVTRPDAPGCAHSRSALQHLQREVGVVMAGGGQFDAREVAVALDAPIVAVVPRDPRAASIACGGRGSDRLFRRSRLVTAARRLVASLEIEPELEWVGQAGIAGVVR